MPTRTTSDRVRRAWASAAIAVIGLGTALLLAAPAQADGEHHHIEISQYMYMPMSMAIEQGETVTWTNKDQAEHDVTVTSGPASFQSPLLAKGESWSYTFGTPGEYSYICSVHPEMRSTVTVAAAKAVTPPAPKPSKPAARPSASASLAPTTAAPQGGGPQVGKAPGADVVKADTGNAQTAPAPTVQTALPQAVSSPQSSATLQPLILVVGASVMAVVFCLLLMASRPVPAADPDSAPTHDAAPLPPKHLNEP